MTDPVSEAVERAERIAPAQPARSAARQFVNEAAACIDGELTPRGVTAMQRAAGNRAVGRLLARSIQPRTRVLARDTTATITSPLSTPTTADTWAQAQSDWTAIVTGRDRMEAAMAGTSVTLGGENSVDLVRSDETLAAVRRATRHRLMEMMYLIWNSYRGADLTGARTAGDPASAMVALQAKVLAQVKPIYDALEAGKPPEERFEYEYTDSSAGQWTQSVRDAVAEVAGLIAQASAETARADPEAAHRAAKLIVGDADWCGAFAYNRFGGAGVDLPVTALGQNPLAWTGPWSLGVGIDGFFQYLPALEIKLGPATWTDVRAYHEQRGSLRKFQVLPASGTAFDNDTRKYEKSERRGGMVGSLDSLDIQPGDLVMIDRAKGTFADHIAMCRAYDSSTHHLWTIGGNEGAAHPVNASGMWDLDANPAPVSVEGDAKHARVYAVARFSAVDFEPHIYRRKN
jgi:hypothetical protein